LTGNPEVIASFVGLVPLNAQIGHKGAIGTILFGAATGGRAGGYVLESQKEEGPENCSQAA
jgi:hypothetical protein